MSRASTLAVVALVALTACDSTTPIPPVRFAQPAAVAVFRGVTTKNPGVHPYVAVANAGSHDLTLIDAVDDRAVLAPILTRSLAVPVPGMRPTLLVSSSLWDGPDLDVDPPDPTRPATADLLVVASESSPVLQLVQTWSADVRTLAAEQVDLGAIAPGAEVLALVAAPVPDAGVPPRRTPGRVRVVAALTENRLAVVEYVRAGEAIVAEAAEVRTLEVGGAPFQPVALAVSPFDPAHVYVATPDPIGGVFGVAELDARGPLAAWTVRALDARGPTSLVAAWRLHERQAAESGDPPGAFEAAPVDRVYAALDRAGCGPDRRVPCGIAVLDPVTGGMRADYAGLMPYLAPISVPATPLALTISGPPAVAASATDPAQFKPPWMRISPASGARGTSAVMAIPSSDGRVYFADLARWAVPNERSILRTDSRTSVTSAAAGLPSDTVRRLGFWDVGAESSTVTTEAARLATAVTVTPGFTRSETWTVTFQGELPGLASGDVLYGQTGRAEDGRTTLALQVPVATSDGAPRFTQVVRLYDPAFGLHPGDIVTLAAAGIPGCPAGPVEARVAELRAPTADAPGGSVVLEGSIVDPVPVELDTGELVFDDWPACVAAAGNGYARVPAAFRAGGLVVTGSVTGYAGRPELLAAPVTADTPGFSLAYQDEDALSCPLDPWPADPAAVPCDAACRDSCEALALVRRARRHYHVSDRCLGVTPGPVPSSLNDYNCTSIWEGRDFPKANGPVIAFKLGYVPKPDAEGDPGDPGGAFPAEDQTLWPELRRLGIQLTTQNGLSPSSRLPLTGGAAAPILPRGAAAFDRSPYPGKAGDAYRFYVPYAHDFIFDMSPAQPINLPVVIR
jgi:hypothetical protein